MIKVKDVNIFQISECEGIDIKLENGKTVVIYFVRDNDTYELRDIRSSDDYGFEYIQECMRAAFEFMAAKVKTNKPEETVVIDDCGWDGK